MCRVCVARCRYRISITHRLYRGRGVCALYSYDSGAPILSVSHYSEEEQIKYTLRSGLGTAVASESYSFCIVLPSLVSSLLPPLRPYSPSSSMVLHLNIFLVLFSVQFSFAAELLGATVSLSESVTLRQSTASVLWWKIRAVSIFLSIRIHRSRIVFHLQCKWKLNFFFVSFENLLENKIRFSGNQFDSREIANFDPHRQSFDCKWNRDLRKMSASRTHKLFECAHTVKIFILKWSYCSNTQNRMNTWMSGEARNLHKTLGADK